MNPNHITTTPHHNHNYNHNHNPNRQRTFTVNFFNTLINTTVTSTPAIARQWVYNLRHNHHDSLNSSSLVIGLGVQWHPSSTSASTLQLCVGPNCLIFQLSHSPSIPATLRRLLSDDRITFVGVHNRRDINMMRNSVHELDVEYLVDLAVEEGFGNCSMEDMAEDVLGYPGIVKPRGLGLSNWDQFWLTNAQVQYACVDAYVSYLLATALGYPYDDDDDDDEYDEDDDEYDDDEEEEEEEEGEYDDDGGYYYDDDDEYLNYDDYCNPLNYNRDG